MIGEFRKLLQDEFGGARYLGFVRTVLEEERDGFVSLGLTWMFCISLREKSRGELLSMRERLNEALLSSYRISKGYLIYVLCCVFVLMLLFFQVDSLPVFFLASAAVLGCFAFKTKEYLINKYCYVDAKIILSYKLALEKLLKPGESGAGQNRA